MFFEIQKIVYLYAIICVLLVIYIISYVLKEDLLKRLNQRYTRFWYKAIQQGMEKESISHKKLLLKKLTSIHQLIAFETAYKQLEKEFNKKKIHNYMGNYMEAFQVLALKYSKKEPMKKAYFAYVIASCWGKCDKDGYQLTEILVGYLINTTIYCRENVLQALYRIGNVEAVERAFSILNTYGYFHHTKLLADGLINFSGNQKKLARALWQHYNEWDEEIMVAIIQFITRCDGSFVEDFYCIMDDPSTPLEVTLAIIRYYKKYYYQPAGYKLREYVKMANEQHTTRGIVAVSALENYPSQETKAVLKEALCHKAWYIRHHAAEALMTLDITLEEINKIIEGPDRYAAQMLTYVLSQSTTYKEEIQEVS